MIIAGLLMWLLKLVDFREASELSWGSIVLATLYQEMCRVTTPQKIKIGGCMLLLQSRADYPYTFSLVTRWNHGPSHVGLPNELQDM
ncbi:serine/threonine-protein phosphatase 7 long form-like protein [Gossypium australe]|uniref:Serine/threonine-protein phosphatase 7 long form-like protein n=1 Tax=Gossypium australe TaxID=47621 RepID=A0A5B6VCN2_9ROSI|nr:serine/threonine-protein phosphatase 7 long form-like protein [Gossypium australe]